MTTNTDTSHNIAVAGSAADGNGVLTGWDGRGSLTRAEILAALAEADLPSGWAPSPRSLIAHAGAAISALSGYGYVTRRDRKATERRDIRGRKVRAYAARWIVIAADTATAIVGDAAGAVVLTAELRDGDASIHLEGRGDLIARIRGDYEAARGGELYRAGDVTAWLRSVILGHLGGTRYAMGYYVPARHRAAAARLFAAIAPLWGRNWASPPLPVATSTELRQGIARAFADEISQIARKLVDLRAKARETGKPLAPSAAATLLRELADVDSRADAYRVLCGAEALAVAVAELRTLSTELAELADDSSQRFALLELDVAPAPSPSPSPAPAADPSPSPAPAADPSPWPLRQPSAPAPEPGDSSDRFALLELD